MCASDDSGANIPRTSCTGDFGGAFVIGAEVLVGAIALQEFDLTVAPSLETLTVLPASPRKVPTWPPAFAYGLRFRPHLKASLGPVLSGT
jgi:hypothetical protein